MAISEGKRFEENFKDSVKAAIPKIFYMRIKDNQLSFATDSKTSQNPYDCIVFDQGYLFTLELKSTKSKSLSFAETVVKEHQITNLLESNTYKNIISGFLINFREPENKVLFVHIEDYVRYKKVAQGELDWTYKSKINNASLPIGIAEEIGLEITGKIKRVNYKYDIKQFIDEAIKRNHSRLWLKGETR